MNTRYEQIIYDLYNVREILIRDSLKKKYGQFDARRFQIAIDYAIFALEHVDSEQFFRLWEAENNEE